MPKSTRILTAVAALMLLALYALPLWSIHLEAPQYPEGLGMYIRIDTIVGATEFDLGKINNLNHYIGMRPIEADAIPELRYMPWLVGALVVGGLAAAALGRRNALFAWLLAFAVLAAAGLLDFYRWSYDYGHNLDAETAIITVPGMSYQPPLIGSKQLLNFRATSWPAAGGWIAGIALALGALAAVLGSRAAGRAAGRAARRGALTATAVSLAACGASGPRALHYDGTESCAYCRMAISDPRFGAQIVTSTGRTHRFDSIECLASFYVQARHAGNVGSVWVSDFARPGTFIPAHESRFVHTKGPGTSTMTHGLAAFGPTPNDSTLRARYGQPMRWLDVVEAAEMKRARARTALEEHHSAR